MSFKWKQAFLLAAFTTLFSAPSAVLKGQVPSNRLSGKSAEKFAELLQRDWKQKPEWAEMLAEILQGKQMGPNAGWFKSSEKVLGWDWMSQNFDTNQDGKVTRREGDSFDRVFDAIDKNRDGKISPEDFNWDDVSHVGPTKPSEAMFLMLDRDSNGRVDQKEIMQLMANLDEDKKGYLTPDEFANGFGVFDDNPFDKEKKQQKVGPKQDPNRMMNMLFNGEFGTLTEGPKIGAAAPDFELPLLKGDGKVKLSSFLGDKIVVLNFGSFT